MQPPVWVWGGRGGGRGSAPGSVPGRPAARGAEGVSARAPSVPAQPRARLGGGSATRRLGNPQPQSCRRRSFVRRRRRRRRRRLRVPPAGGGETRKGKKEKKEEEGTEAAARAHSRRPRPPPGGSAAPALGLYAPPAPGPARPPGHTAAAAAAAPSARPGRSHPEPPASLRRARGARRRLNAPGRRLGAPAQLNSPESAAAGPGGRVGRRGEARPAPGDRERAGEEERVRERAQGADTMPGWKKNIPICLQAEEQERGERGDRAGRVGEGVRAGGRPGASLSPGSLPTCPRPTGEGRRALRGRGGSPGGGSVRTPDFFLFGGGWGVGEKEGAAVGNF